jgi:hypothetical protein
MMALNCCRNYFVDARSKRNLESIARKANVKWQAATYATRISNLHFVGLYLLSENGHNEARDLKLYYAGSVLSHKGQSLPISSRQKATISS